MATNFFEDFPRIAYTLDDGETDQVVTDIFKRAVLAEEFKNNSSFLNPFHDDSRLLRTVSQKRLFELTKFILTFLVVTHATFHKMSSS